MKRRFRELRKRPPRASYDVVVVGSGIGGLISANLLARAGLSVLLVEQHYMTGGYCSTFRRAGYTFDAATHFYPLLGNPQSLTGKLLADLDVETGWVKMDPVDTFHLPDGSRFTVPADYETYRRRLAALFPTQEAALDEFFRQVKDAYFQGLLAFFRSRQGARFEAIRHLTVRDVLDRCFSDPKLKLLLTADCPHWGSPPRRTSFAFDSMLRLSYFLGNYYPVGGSQAFADDLARRFTDQGGEILMSSRVEHIQVEKDRATGVEIETLRGGLRGRHRVASGAVVYNGDPSRGAARSAGLEPKRPLRPSFPCFLTHLGLTGVSAERLEEAQGYYWRSWDPDEVGKRGLIGKIFVPTLYEPRLAPAGGHIVILQKVQELEPGSVEDWSRHKASVEQELLSHLETVLPEVKGRIVVKTSATARTSERFTGNRHGAMLGWEMSPDQLGETRPPQEGPVRGLYFVGHWTRPGGGITPVMVSARQVVEKILAGHGRSEVSRRGAMALSPWVTPPARPSVFTERIDGTA